jgi:hypothetical protein
MELFPGPRLDVTEVYPGTARKVTSRHKDRDVCQRIELRWGDGIEKMHRYGEQLRALMGDQLAWVNDPTHQRKVTEQNGLDSLALAVRACQLAECGSRG